MNPRHAGQIAELLNQQNQLVVPYTAERILQAAANYLCEFSDEGDVIACAELKKVQWYQFEIDHVTVRPAFEGKGYARRLLERCEQKARETRGRVLQCTIREGNERSQILFEKSGFVRTAGFYYPDTGNNVGIWQKVISPARVKDIPKALTPEPSLAE